MLKLYYMPGACSLATHIVLEWIGAPYEAQRVSRAELKSPAYLQINPAGAVPALLADGTVLTQNAAVLNYLAERFPAARLGGDGTAIGHATVQSWLGFANSDIHPAFKPLFGATAYLEDEAAIEKSKAHARKMLRAFFERIDAQLQNHDWIAGSRSIADPYLFAMLRWTPGVKVDLSGLGAVERFQARMHQDKGVAQALKDEGLA